MKNKIKLDSKIDNLVDSSDVIVMYALSHDFKVAIKFIGSNHFAKRANLCGNGK